MMGEVNTQSCELFQRTNAVFHDKLVSYLQLAERSRVNKILCSDFCESRNIEEVYKACTLSLKDIDELMLDFSNEVFQIQLLGVHGFIRNNVALMMSSSMDIRGGFLHQPFSSVDGSFVDKNGFLQSRGISKVRDIQRLETPNHNKTLLAAQNLIQGVLRYNEVDFSDGVQKLH